MREHRGIGGIMTRSRLGRFAALLALLGFLFSVSGPGPMAGMDPVTGAVICHAEGAQGAPGGDEDAPRDDGCCLVCQAAQLAKGALPPQHFTLPTESAAHARLSQVARVAVDGIASRHTQARAPPVA